MNRAAGRILAAMIILGGLGAATYALSRPDPAADHSPAGYWIAAQYFRARRGTLGRGLNLLVTRPTRSEVQELYARLKMGKTALVVVQAPSELATIVQGLRAQVASGVAIPEWPDPTVAKVGAVRLGSRAFAMGQATGPPLLATTGRAVVLTRLEVGRGALFLVTDPGFFSNAELGWSGHLQILANLVRESGGALDFAQWPTPPVRLAVPNPGRLLSLGLALLPGLLLLLWALGARFGAVRRARSPQQLAADDREALSWLLRRRQAGRLALEVLLEEHRDALPAALRQEISFRIARGAIGTRELRRWRQRIAENGGTRVG